MVTWLHLLSGSLYEGVCLQLVGGSSSCSCMWQEVLTQTASFLCIFQKQDGSAKPCESPCRLKGDQNSIRPFAATLADNEVRLVGEENAKPKLSIKEMELRHCPRLANSTPLMLGFPVNI